jgi:CheY-like chemotaxis protein
MPESNTISRLAGLRILAVDDEPDILETIVDVLDGATVDCAKSYEEALAKLKAQAGGARARYDLAVLDIMGVDGMALLQQTVGRGIPTVMLTAHALNPQSLKASIVDGALSYLPKEELVNLAEHIGDVLEAIEQNQSPWKRVFSRLGKVFDQTFGSGWETDDPDFWNKYKSPSYGVFYHRPPPRS